VADSQGGRRGRICPRGGRARPATQGAERAGTGPGRHSPCARERACGPCGRAPPAARPRPWGIAAVRGWTAWGKGRRFNGADEAAMVLTGRRVWQAAVGHAGQQARRRPRVCACACPRPPSLRDRQMASGPGAEATRLTGGLCRGGTGAAAWSARSSRRDRAGSARTRSTSLAGSLWDWLDGYTSRDRAALTEARRLGERLLGARADAARARGRRRTGRRRPPTGQWVQPQQGPAGGPAQPPTRAASRGRARPPPADEGRQVGQ